MSNPLCWVPCIWARISSSSSVGRQLPQKAGLCSSFPRSQFIPRTSHGPCTSLLSFTPMRMNVDDFNVPPGAASAIEELPLEAIPAGDEPLPSHWRRPGVYGIYNASGDLMYIAAVHDVQEAIDRHRRFIADPSLVHWARMLTVDSVDQAPLDTLAQNWLISHARDGPGAPIGNTDEGEAWRAKDLPQGGDICFSQGASVEEAVPEIQRILRSHKVVLFMKGTRDAPRCGFSMRAVSILKSKLGHNDLACVDCLDEFKNPGLRDQIKKYSDWPTIPQLYVDGEFVGGSDIVVEMEGNGELTAVLESAGVRVKETRSEALA